MWDVAMLGVAVVTGVCLAPLVARLLARLVAPLDRWLSRWRG